MTTYNKSPLRALAAATLLAAVVLPDTATATEPFFTYTYLTETTPKGAFEVEQWFTYRAKKSQGTYELWQSRTELEYGITDRWSVSLYANAYQVTAQADNSNQSRNDYTTVGDGDEVSGGGPVTFGDYVPNATRLPIPSARYVKQAFDSVSIESIYQSCRRTRIPSACPATSNTRMAATNRNSNSSCCSRKTSWMTI